MGTGKTASESESLEKEHHRLRQELEDYGPLLELRAHRDLKSRLDDVTMKLVTAHRGLIVGTARSFWRSGEDESYLDDIRSAATLGFLEALNRHDPEKGPLGPWARPRIKDEVNDLVRRTERPWLSTRSWAARPSALKLCADMTAAEVAAELGIGLSEVLTILENVPMRSLDQTTVDGETTIGEGVDDADRLWVSVQSWCTDEVLREMTADLSPQELSAFGTRHGFCFDYKATYEELGDMFGMSDEWVRRRAEAANKKVRAWLLTHKPDLAAHRRKAARLERIGIVEGSPPTIELWPATTTGAPAVTRAHNSSTVFS